MKYFSFLIFSFLLISCDVQFEPDTRTEIIGNIIDENNIPINTIEVSSYTLTSSPLTSLFSIFLFAPINEGDYLLGKGFSNEDGSFAYTSLFDRDKDFYVFVDGKGTYTNYIYSTSTSNYLPSNFTFDLGEIQLNQLSTVNININRTSGSNNELDFNVNYKTTNCIEIYVEGELDDSSLCYREEFFSNQLDDDNPDYSTEITSFISAEIQFSYSINGSTEVTETYIINQDNYEINFSY